MTPQNLWVLEANHSEVISGLRWLTQQNNLEWQRTLQIRDGYWVAIPWISNGLSAFPMTHKKTWTTTYYTQSGKIPGEWNAPLTWRTIRGLAHVKIWESWHVIGMDTRHSQLSRKPVLSGLTAGPQAELLTPTVQRTRNQSNPAFKNRKASQG